MGKAIIRFYGQSVEKAMAPHSSTLAWKIPWTEEPGGLQSMGSRRVEHDWATSLSLFTFMHWRRKWQPTPVFLPGESQGRRSLVGCRLWGRTESDTTEATQQQQQCSFLIWSCPQVVLVEKNPPPSAGDVRDVGSIPGWGGSPGGEQGKPLLYSCLESTPWNREPLQVMMHGAAKAGYSWSNLAHNHAPLIS